MTTLEYSMRFKTEIGGNTIKQKVTFKCLEIDLTRDVEKEVRQ